MAEQPPLSRIHVVGYSSNDRNYPIVSLVADPRVAGYRVPEDLSVCPDKRYPNHVFTGAQPLSGDERVRHTWEILPSPYVPFTRYDDDLGPVQGRRRFVVNSGQEASLERDKKVTYEAREGSAIVSNEIEETWDAGSADPDVDSPFPIKDRDFYDPSRGAVQERRQLVSTTGNEVATLENKDGVITQTSYEAYNEFLSFKVVQTYSVDGPQLVGFATNNEGQLTTVTTQRKGSDGYVPPDPTATRTVEANREDSESLVERIVDIPQVFGAEVYRKTREDLTPQKFKAAQEDSTVEENVEGTADSSITLETGEFAKSEQQVSKLIKRVSLTSRSTTVNPDPLVEKVLTNEGQIGTRILTLAAGPQSFNPSATLIDANVEALGDGRTVKTEVTVENVFSNQTKQQTKADLTPQKFKAKIVESTSEVNVAGTVGAFDITNSTGVFSRSERQVTEFVKTVSETTRTSEVVEQLSSKAYTSDLGGGVATTTETLSTNSSIDNTPTGNPQLDSQSIKGQIVGIGEVYKTGLISAEAEALGDGRFIKRISVLDEIEELKGVDYDESLDIRIPFTQKIVNAKEPLPLEGAISIQPRDAANSLKREFDVTEFASQIESYYWEIPDMVSVDLPDRLVAAKAYFSRTNGEQGGRGEGATYSWNASGSSSIAGELVFTTESGYKGLVPATKSIFFLQKDSATTLGIVQKLRAIDSEKSRTLTQYYPNVRPKSHGVTMFGGSISRSQSKSLSVASESNSFGSSASVSIGTSYTPATIHSSVPIDVVVAGANTIEAGTGAIPIEDDITIRIIISGGNEFEDKEIINPFGPPTIIPANYTTSWYEGETKNPAIPPTEFPEFPDGRYLMGLNATPYRFGYIRIEAMVAEIFSPYIGSIPDQSEYGQNIVPIPQASSYFPPLIPADITFTNITSNSFGFNWSPVDGASGYRLDVSPVSSFSSFVEGYENVQINAFTNSWVVSGLSSLTTFYIRLRSTTSSGGLGKYAYASVETIA
jgi:hypothetical protein